MKNVDTIIFLHIPKTAGSTFHDILNRKYSKREIRNVFGARYGDPEIRAVIESPREENARIRLLKGHMPFGLHRYFPRPERVRYIGFVRDPVERVISLYYYILKNAHNPLHKDVAEGNMSLEEFVRSGLAIGTNNGHCRFINGDIDEYGFLECDEQLLENAKRHIRENFLWLGVTERFDESMLVLARLMGWQRAPYYFKANTSKNRKSTSQISEEELRVVEQYNRLDRQLYDFANSLLDEHIGNIDGFDRHLQNYREENARLQQRYGWLPDRIRRFFL